LTICQRLIAGALLVSGLAVATPPAAAQPRLDPTITLFVRDDVGLPSMILRYAEDEVRRIFRAVGLGVAWHRAGAPRVPQGAAAKFWLIIQGDELAELRALPKPVLGAAPGTPQRRGRLAYVFYHRIEQVSNAFNVDSALILAHAIAHEIGHLLLPTSGHTSTGLMRASWDRHDLQDATQGALGFSPQQADLIRAALIPPDAVADDRRPSPQRPVIITANRLP